MEKLQIDELRKTAIRNKTQHVRKGKDKAAKSHVRGLANDRNISQRHLNNTEQ